jgi:CheY-like chemotaxis protein
MQGGGIGVRSTQGIGSTFSFYIKCRRATSPHPKATSAEVFAQNKAQTTNNTDEPILRQPMPSKSHLHYHVLVVEDNLINQRVLCSQLKKIGCTVQVANHGREALEELKKTTFSRKPTVSPPFKLSVVLMDVEMPVMDGNTCTQRIRQLQREGDIIGHVPIIAVSANARREQIEQAKQAGMDDAISKPFRIPELMGIIHRLLDKDVA